MSGGQRRCLSGTSLLHPRLRFSDTHRPKRHLRGWAVRAPLPCKEHGCVGLSDVIAAADPERASCAVNTARRSFDFPEVSDGSLIQHNVACAVTPLCAIFFIAKRGREAERAQDRVGLLAILHACFQFSPHFMATG